MFCPLVSFGAFHLSFNRNLSKVFLGQKGRERVRDIVMYNAVLTSSMSIQLV